MKNGGGLMSCDSGLIEETGDESYWVEVTQYTTLGFTLFVWRHELEWEWSYCVSECTDCVPLIDDPTVDDAGHHSYSVESDSTVVYEGNVSADLNIDNSDTWGNVTSFRQDFYSSSVPYFSGCNPSSKLWGNSQGMDDLLDYNSC